MRSEPIFGFDALLTPLCLAMTSSSLARVMAYTLKINGFDVEASTAAEAAALLRELQHGPKPAPPSAPAIVEKTPQIPAGNGAMSDLDPASSESALKFLRTIRDSGTGIEADRLMSALGVTKPKGIGSKSASVNRVLKAVGLKPRFVYSNPRGPTGRIWKPAKRMGEAIQLLEQRSTTH